LPCRLHADAQTNVRRLLDALGSNLQALRPVLFDWDQDDMDYLYGQGPYVSRVPPPRSDLPLRDNIFDDDHVLEGIQRDRPDGMRDPEAFQRAVELGQINRQLVENVRACTLSVGKFYLQRPPTLDTPFVLVKVVRIVIDDDTGLQWGAFVHPWELSTTGPDLNYFTDPWHASAAHKESQRFNVRLGPHGQGPAWTYPLSVLTEFQEEVALNAAWSNPKYAHTRTTPA